MGSSGTGRFGNYPGGNGGSISANGQNGISGGGVGEIECPMVIEHIRLEDVAVSEYYVNNNALPDQNDGVALSNRIFNGRLVVTSALSNEIIGNLPTRYNYLINCINRGVNYSGRVISSGISPVPFVVVTLHV